MRVVAAPGHRVPMQEDPHQHIGDAEAVEVADTSYYRRRIAAGELLTAKKPRGGAKQPVQESAE
ncbi:DUF2635 domain-containing protein [Pseudomonas sp. 18.1.10]|uniref:DUF2635 domain-containing protein n=1 Tax=Pseudomonas sp. 18.1.10 TaxID=2969302 RepID=UPI0035B2CBFE